MRSDFSQILRPVGWGRYVESAFLGIWLAFWLIGEIFALAFLGAALIFPFIVRPRSS
jgi:hypothetical protein